MADTTDTVPTIIEIRALTARLRRLATPGAGVNPGERERFLSDKAALLARIADAGQEEVRS
ncbi:MAG: hypothetical protein ACRDRH_13670 [Pseudonocardia sp.]